MMLDTILGSGVLCKGQKTLDVRLASQSLHDHEAGEVGCSCWACGTHRHCLLSAGLAECPYINTGSVARGISVLGISSDV